MVWRVGKSKKKKRSQSIHVQESGVQMAFLSAPACLSSFNLSLIIQFSVLQFRCSYILPPYRDRHLTARWRQLRRTLGMDFPNLFHAFLMIAVAVRKLKCGDVVFFLLNFFLFFSNTVNLLFLHNIFGILRV